MLTLVLSSGSPPVGSVRDISSHHHYHHTHTHTHTPLSVVGPGRLQWTFSEFLSPASLKAVEGWPLGSRLILSEHGNIFKEGGMKKDSWKIDFRIIWLLNLIFGCTFVTIWLNLHLSGFKEEEVEWLAPTEHFLIKITGKRALGIVMIILAARWACICIRHCSLPGSHRLGPEGAVWKELKGQTCTQLSGRMHLTATCRWNN